MSRTILAVDPGIDDTGIALFELAGWQPSESFERVLTRLRTTEVLRTAPSQPLSVRLNVLARGIERIILAATASKWPVALMYLEQPRTGGTYRQRGRPGLNAGDLSLLFMAMGALIGAAGGRSVEVRLVPAPRLAKPVRHQSILLPLAALHHPLAAQKRRSPDLLDAIWLGATCLTSPGHRPEAA
jgi:hypothetical protein